MKSFQNYRGVATTFYPTLVVGFITSYIPTHRPLILPVVLYRGWNLDSHIEGGKQAEGVRK
jgi:hypothetical protein